MVDMAANSVTKQPQKLFHICQCFFTHNYYVPKLNLHFVYNENDDDIVKQAKEVIGDRTDISIEDDVLAVIHAELKRRKSLHADSAERRGRIGDKYQRLHPELWTLDKNFLHPDFPLLLDQFKPYEEGTKKAKDVFEISPVLKREKAERIYSFPVFTKGFCDNLLEEMENFEKSDLPKGRPNTMNKYGILLDELGFNDGLLTPLREMLHPLTSILYPEWGGDCLDSHKAFIVKYETGPDGDPALSYHYDNAEVTLNVALGGDYQDGQLYLGDMAEPGRPPPPTDQVTFARYDHVPQWGLLHRGLHRHGAMPITDGVRYNLIMWMRSSKVRAKQCPMCGQRPELVGPIPDSMADGYLAGAQDSAQNCTAS